MRTFQIGKDGKMVDIGWDIQAEFDRPPLLNYGQDNHESEIDSDPFPPLAAEPTTDTATDRVLDAALRSHGIKFSEVLICAFQWHTVARREAQQQGKKYFAKGYEHKNLVYLTETGKRACKIGDLIDDRKEQANG